MIVHLNGSLLDADAARISPFDRGFLFGDGVYEGLRASRSHIIGLPEHVDRLRDGLAETRIAGFDPESLGPISHALLDANGLADAFIYWQITRGVPLPGQPLRQRVPGAGPPTVFGYAAPLPALPPADAGEETQEFGDFAIPLRLRTEAGVLSFISTTTVFGAVHDITLEELAIESFYPADEQTERMLRSSPA